jgi:hypothetical protein
MNLFNSVAELANSGYVFRIQDNGGASADRYTVVLCDDDYLTMSSGPTHPQGVSMWGEGIDPQALSDWAETGEAVDLALGDLPPHIADHVVSRVNEAWRDFLDDLERREQHAVAATRDAAEVNEGTYTSGGVGIYLTDEGFRIRLDGDIADDRGPFTTAREALLASLPDADGLSGPEYQSPEDVARLTPSPEVGARLAELEARVQASFTDGADISKVR